MIDTTENRILVVLLVDDGGLCLDLLLYTPEEAHIQIGLASFVDENVVPFNKLKSSAKL
jgi:hypothetical protein